MSNHILRWQAKKARAEERRAWIRIDDVKIEEAGKQGYEVTVRGHHLHGVVAPPSVTVGGERVANLRFSEDGRALQGTLKRKPEGHECVVDYGFARASYG